MEQIDVFMELDRISKGEDEQIKNDLTPRAWALYRALKATAGRKMSG